MDSSGEEKKTGEEIKSAIGSMETKQTEETDQHAGKVTLKIEFESLKDVELYHVYSHPKTQNE